MHKSYLLQPGKFKVTLESGKKIFGSMQKSKRIQISMGSLDICFLIDTSNILILKGKLDTDMSYYLILSFPSHFPLRKKCPHSEFFWSVFFSATYLSVFSLNAGKYGPENFQIRTLFTQCPIF